MLHRIFPNTFASAALLMSLTVISDPARAQSSETWVSGAGSDQNSCSSPSSACQQIYTAMGKTAAGGTVHVLPGDYNFFPITKAIQITADAGNASITGGGSCSSNVLQYCTAIYVQAGASDVVRIRGFMVNQVGGIVFASGAALELERVTLVQAGSGTSVNGLAIIPSSGAANGMPTSITVRDSAIDASSGGNVLIAPTNGVAVNAVFDRVSTSYGRYGIRADSTNSGKIRVDARDSVAADNTNNGYLAVGNGANPVHFMIERSTASGNGVNGAAATGAQAFMLATNSTLIGNGNGLAQLAGSTVAVNGTNTINFNTENTSGTITTIGAH